MRIEGDCPVVGVDGPIQVALLAEGDAEVEVGVGVAGLQPGGPAEARGGLVRAPRSSRTMPRQLWAAAYSGLKAMARRKAAAASDRKSVV